MNKLSEFKLLLKRNDLDGYLIPKYDLYFSEEVIEPDDRLKFISKFSGSAGWGLVVSHKAKSAIISDGRYQEQIKKEVNQNYFKFLNGGLDKIVEFIKDSQDLKKIGIDPKLIPLNQFKYLKNKLNHLNVDLKLIKKNMVDLVWLNKPKIPTHNISYVPKKYVGESFYLKQEKILKYIEKYNCNAFFSCKPDSISWMLNIRDNQLNYSHVVRCFSLIHQNKNLYMFFENLPEKVAFSKIKNCKIYSNKNLEEVLKYFKNTKFLIDPSSTSIFMISLFEKFKIKIVYSDCPISHLKTKKNSTEKANLKKAHKVDALAFIKFWSWFQNKKNINLENEESLSKKLLFFRSENKLFKGNSFPTISAIGKNGSIIHYRYQKNKSSKISRDDLYLIDSGGQYLNGTTDVTRVLIRGLPTKDMKKKYTLVLKGHLALSNLIFPKGTRGKDIDSIARIFLWEHKLDYPHGTGHGVGYYLNVHEGPISISKSNSYEIKSGMVISNEPGFYGKNFGIRIENLELVKKNGKFLKFETLTLIPFEKKLIEKTLLTKKEIDLINKYHQKVSESILPMIQNDKVLIKFLKSKTSKL